MSFGGAPAAVKFLFPSTPVALWRSDLRFAGFRSTCRPGLLPCRRYPGVGRLGKPCTVRQDPYGNWLWERLYSPAITRSKNKRVTIQEPNFIGRMLLAEQNYRLTVILQRGEGPLPAATPKGAYA